MLSSQWGATMTNEQNATPDPAKPIVYQIRIKGHLGQQWMDWFEGLTITLEEDGNTLMAGTVIDQAALHGLIKKVRDLGLPLLSVNPIESGQAKKPKNNQLKRRKK